MEAETLPPPTRTRAESRPRAAGSVRSVRTPPLWALALVAVVLAIWTASRNITDVNGYHCYALAFWGGRAAAATLPFASAPLPQRACLIPLSAISITPFHTLPAEYGPLALLAFLPPLAFPAGWYNTVFFVEMALVMVALAWLLWRYGAPGAGQMWLVYALIGSMALVAGRFDALPAACVVVTLIALRRGKLPLAYAALALGALLKFYPLVLLPLMLIESWRARDREPLWRGPALCAALIAVVEGVAALLDPAGALGPLAFMGARCTQVESLPATLGFLWAKLSGASVTYPYAYNSDCLQTAVVGPAGDLALLAALAGMALVVALYWRRRVTLGLASLLLVALLILGSKVFSPQYLVWLSPLVALEYGAEATPLLAWGVVCLGTTLCFPFAYVGRFDLLLRQPTEIVVTLFAGVRNALLAGLTVAVLWRVSRGAGLQAGREAMEGGAL